MLIAGAHQKSNAYAIAQFVLIALFALIYFFEPGPAMFFSVSIAGTVLCVAGLMLISVAFVSLRRVLRVQPEPKAGGYLVTSGVYRWLRHPMYTGVVLIVIGLFVHEPGMYVAAGVLVVVAFLVFKSRFEEQLLRERYSGYAEYMKHSWGVL